MTALTLTYQDPSDRERRHFRRIVVQRSGEFVWTTKPRFGRTKTFRELVTTHNLSVKGAKIIVPGDWDFTTGTRGRFKLSTEFSDAEVLEAESNGVSSTIRVVFLGPSPAFVEAIKAETAREEERFSLRGLWTTQDPS